ncbi:MAG: PLDc N-terminal domain-containing protein [Caldilineaceae bacterium]|nr:PLDc N-terminal domain-containing protein [Caldilineaceae bacterium]MBP8109666.1 PLDc N-terminal domain-containing protein [Caldilineaceae bacterium]MBP8125547.1 PLDc N-terminal domain-containing protein [Caldilineaceae bacterium]MBP9071850.1 PLDc N-terminal domain-containing protein [Caldilineaceae bacterium]
MATLLSVYLYLLPIVIYTAWVAIALYDLGTRKEGGWAVSLGWMALILLVPVVGVVIYYALGRSTIPGWQRVTLLVGGPVAYGILLVIGNLVGGVA